MNEMMKAGREIDALIAERVFARTHLVGALVPEFFRHRDEPEERQEVWTSADHREWWCRACGSLPEFSTDIAAAWLVVEKMRELGWWCATFVGLHACSANFSRPNENEGDDHEALAMPHAICLAALTALEPIRISEDR